MNRNILNFCISALLLNFLYSCGGASQSTNTYQAPEAKNEAPIPAVQINTKNDSKGLGKFTSVNLEPIKTSEVKKGELVFTTRCATCHTLTSDRLIGPGLKGITAIRTPEWILNMITNPEENLQKDPLGKALLDEYKSVMPNFAIPEEEAKQILEFLRQNDLK